MCVIPVRILVSVSGSAEMVASTPPPGGGAGGSVLYIFAFAHIWVENYRNGLKGYVIDVLPPGVVVLC